MHGNKLVIRRLPPSMSENEFLKHVSPLPEHDYFCFFEANSTGLGPHSFGRAYINFVNASDTLVFKERFDNYVFLDKEGHEYPGVVEQSLWHKSPKDGPFYFNRPKISNNDDNDKDEEVEGTSSNDLSNSNEANSWIEDDSDFAIFIENLQAQKKKSQHSPIQTIETNLDELTKQQPSNNTSSNSGIKKDNSKVITPLIGYVNKQRNSKSSIDKQSRLKKTK